MTDRPSMWSQVVLSRWIASARCPQCHVGNQPMRKRILELHEDNTVLCLNCGHWFEAKRPPVEPVG